MKKYFSDQEIVDYINSPEMHVSIFSITSPTTGQHYSSPVWPYYFDWKIYISTDSNNLKSKFIKSGKVKAGLTIIDKNSWPNGQAGRIPYVSLSGSVSLRLKDELPNYTEIIDKLYAKFEDWFPTIKDKEEWIDHVINVSETRVLIEIKIEKSHVFEKFEIAAEKRRNEAGD